MVEGGTGASDPRAGEPADGEAVDALRELAEWRAKRFRRARQAKGWTMLDLAERAGIAKSTVVALENVDRLRPSPRTLATLCDALGIAREGTTPELPDRDDLVREAVTLVDRIDGVPLAEGVLPMLRTLAREHPRRDGRGR